MKRFTVTCGPGTCWNVRVIIWPTVRAMCRARGQPCLAFCRQFDADSEKARKKGIIAEIHLCRKWRQAAIVAHEAVHAAVAYAKLAKLDLNTLEGDEQFAECVEYLVANVLHGIKKGSTAGRKSGLKRLL